MYEVGGLKRAVWEETQYPCFGMNRQECNDQCNLNQKVFLLPTSGFFDSGIGLFILRILVLGVGLYLRLTGAGGRSLLRTLGEEGPQLRVLYFPDYPKGSCVLGGGGKLLFWERRR